ncbi:hypothetical protein ACLOJK_013812 [Asimina triloba]
MPHIQNPTSLLLLLLALIPATVLVLPASATSRCPLHSAIAGKGFRVDLVHVDSGGNFTKLELLQRAVKRGKQRLELFRAGAVLAAEGAGDVKEPIHAGNGEFLTSLAIGTPPVPFLAILDTGSDLIWTQCKPCKDCYDQPGPVFDPSKSSSFKKLPCASSLCKALPISKCSGDCEYLYSYGDYSTTQGVLASETFTFGKVAVPSIGFGCGEDNEGKGFSQGDGLMGMGWGPLSFASQLGAGKFSYCLTSLDDTSTSPLLFGSLAQLKKGLNVGSIPLIKSPAQPTYYYISLEGISVGGKNLSIPESTFALQDDGTGGLIIDSGTSITYLEEAGYKALRKAFVSQMQLDEADASSTGLDLCFALPSDVSTVDVPKLVFHFKGADLDLPAENYMILDSGSGLLCLTIMDSSGLSIFGNFQQQNMQILYDLDKKMLSFAPATCNKL